MAIETIREQPEIKDKGVFRSKLVKNISSQIESLEGVKEEREKEIIGLNNKIAVLLKKEESLEEETKASEKTLEAQILKDKSKYSLESSVLLSKIADNKKAIEEYNTTLGDLELEIEGKSSELQDINKSISQAKILEDTLLSSITDKKEELDGLLKDTTLKVGLSKELSKDIDLLTSKKGKLDGVIIRKQEKEELLKNLNTEILSLDSLKETKQVEINDLETQIEKFKLEEKGYIDKLKKLEAREGDASLKESWLLEKEDTLRKIKEELEKFYNRKITNVHI